MGGAVTGGTQYVLVEGDALVVAKVMVVVRTLVEGIRGGDRMRRVLSLQPYPSGRPDAVVNARFED